MHPTNATHRHIKTGGLYVFQGLAHVEIDLSTVVVYKACSDGTTWVRPILEFSEKFVSAFAPAALSQLKIDDPYACWAWAGTARKNHPATAICTDWLNGNLAPAHVGMYERCFTDGVCKHWWDGKQWLSTNMQPHWRQVGSYPCWRGLLSEPK